MCALRIAGDLTQNARPVDESADYDRPMIGQALVDDLHHALLVGARESLARRSSAVCGSP